MVFPRTIICYSTVEENSRLFRKKKEEVIQQQMEQFWFNVLIKFEQTKQNEVYRINRKYRIISEVLYVNYSYKK